MRGTEWGHAKEERLVLAEVLRKTLRRTHLGWFLKYRQYLHKLPLTKDRF